MYRPKNSAVPAPVFIGAGTRNGIGDWIAADAAATPISATFPSANRTHYVPLYIPSTCIAYRMWVLNGATVGTNTWAVALYSSDSNNLPSTRLVTASATSSGANVLQFFDITDQTMIAGQTYWAAIAMNGTTDTCFRWTFQALPHAEEKFFTEASSVPSTATPVKAAGNFLPVFGVSLRSSI